MTTTSDTAGSGLWHDTLGRLAVRCAQLLLVLALVSTVVLGLIRVKLIVIPVLIAVIIAAAVSPVVGWLRRRGAPNALAAAAAMVTGIGALSLVIWLVVRGFRREWPELVAAASSGLDRLQDFLASGPLGITAEQIAQWREAALDALSSDTVSSGAVAGATVAAEVVVGTFFGLVVLFFLLKDGPLIWSFLIRPLPPASQVRAARIGEHSVQTLGGYVRGTATIAIVEAVAIGTVLAIMGVPLALPLATIVFLGAFVPLIGATLAGTLGALVALVANGPGSALAVVGVVVAVNQLENHLLAPVVLARAVRLHALAVLLALTAGTILAGIVGAVLAVPLAAVAWTAVKAWKAPEAAADDGAPPEVEGAHALGEPAERAD